MREKGYFLATLEILQECLEFKDAKTRTPIINKMTIIKYEIEEIDIEIAALISARNVRKIKEHFLTLSEFGNFSVPGVILQWSMELEK